MKLNKFIVLAEDGRGKETERKVLLYLLQNSTNPGQNINRAKLEGKITALIFRGKIELLKPYVSELEDFIDHEQGLYDLDRATTKAGADFLVKVVKGQEFLGYKDKEKISIESKEMHGKSQSYGSLRVGSRLESLHISTAPEWNKFLRSRTSTHTDYGPINYTELIKEINKNKISILKSLNIISDAKQIKAFYFSTQFSDNFYVFDDTAKLSGGNFEYGKTRGNDMVYFSYKGEKYFYITAAVNISKTQKIQRTPITAIAPKNVSKFMRKLGEEVAIGIKAPEKEFTQTKLNVSKNIEDKAPEHTIKFTALKDIKMVNNKEAPGYSTAKIIYRNGQTFNIIG